MSNDENVRLYERAAEMLDELQSHPAGLDDAIEAALQHNDLDELRYAVGRAEAVMSQEHFNGLNILGERDEY